jgi:hypothetical protein
MSARMAQLEEALASLQSQVSNDPHPLLEDTNVSVLLAPKPSNEKPATDEETDVIDSLGTFFIGEKGDVIFHEATATSEVIIFELLVVLGLTPSTQYLLQVHGDSPNLPENAPCQGSLSLPPDLVLLSVLFPFPPETVNTEIDDFVPLLPPFSQAVSLSEIYFEHSAWW